MLLPHYNDRLFGAVITVYSENYTKQCGYNAQTFNVKAGGIYNDKA